jgi:F0F1-type ATP synthase membrane subunit c/vacuolar-type H+-ATPase subunit K
MTHRFRWLLGGIVIAAAAIRIFRLNHFSYGLDEILQAYWLRGSSDYFWHSLRVDGFHPPLDYMIDRALEALRPADAVRKIPPVLWGVGTVATLGGLVARRAGEAAGLAAAGLLAMAPFHVRFSQELRPYSLSLFALCLSLYALDRFLERPRASRLAALFLACLATAYALYTAALVLAIAAGALLLEDARDPRLNRRVAARRFLLCSPVFVFSLWLAYLPWWPVFLEAARRPPFAARAPLSAARAERILSFFAFAPDDGYRLGLAGWFFLSLIAAGTWLALSRRGLRFLAAWGIGGLVAIEVLGQLHPHFDFSRRFVPAGPGWIALAALPIAELLRRPVTRLAGAAVLASVLVLDGRSLSVYFREGRADWRTLAEYLRREALPAERIFTENQYAQLCLAFYLAGPNWLYEVSGGGRPAWDLPNLEGAIVRLTWSWRPGSRAWLVLAGEPRHEELRKWAEPFPTLSFPRAEHAILHRLDPERRAAALPAPR